MAKKLTRVQNGKIAGVCGGIAKYLDLDPTIIRIIWLLLIFVGGCGLLAYLIFALVMPKEENV
jgi:phage shock protein C